MFCYYIRVFICAVVTTSLLDRMLLAELPYLACILMQLLSNVVRSVQLVVLVVSLYFLGSFTFFLTFCGITFSPTVTTCCCGHSFFYDFLSEMLKASISFRFCPTGFMSCMPYPLTWACMICNELLPCPLTWVCLFPVLSSGLLRSNPAIPAILLFLFLVPV